MTYSVSPKLMIERRTVTTRRRARLSTPRTSCADGSPSRNARRAQLSRIVTLRPRPLTAPLLLPRPRQAPQQGSAAPAERAEAVLLGAERDGDEAHDAAVIDDLHPIAGLPPVLLANGGRNHDPA